MTSFSSLFPLFPARPVRRASFHSSLPVRSGGHYSLFSLYSLYSLYSLLPFIFISIISVKSTKKLSLRRFLTEVTKTLLW